jgi:ABC-type siderophore export system fused ATPase/permease subunit
MESLLLAASPFLIFVMIGILLWQMTKSYTAVSASDALMMILMLLMMQGTIRKLFRVPGYVNKGKISLQKIGKLLQQANFSEEAIPLFQNRQNDV